MTTSKTLTIALKELEEGLKTLNCVIISDLALQLAEDLPFRYNHYAIYGTLKKASVVKQANGLYQGTYIFEKAS